MVGEAGFGSGSGTTAASLSLVGDVVCSVGVGRQTQLFVHEAVAVVVIPFYVAITSLLPIGTSGFFLIAPIMRTIDCSTPLGVSEGSGRTQRYGAHLDAVTDIAAEVFTAVERIDIRIFGILL